MMRVIAFILFILVFGVFSLSGQSSTSYDVEFSRICLIDSIAPDTIVQFWRFTQANNPGGITRDYTYDLSGAYNVAGTVVPCCSCLTSASDKATVEIPGAPGNNWGAIGFLAFMGLIVFAFIFLLYMAEMKAARFACTIFFLTLIPVSQGFAQSETSYDVEFTCICLVDSIAADNIVQFWRFTQANNPGGITRDFTYDLSGAYIPTGTVIGCNDYYLGDNPEGSGTAGTLAIWTGTETLGNSSLTEAGEEAAWDLTGALTVPSGTDAQVPVWGAGKLRYNTTTGGFQGGASGYYLPWADADNFGTGLIPFSDGLKLSSNNNFRYLNGKFILGADMGAYTFQNNSTSFFGSNVSSSRTIINGQGVINTVCNQSTHAVSISNVNTAGEQSLWVEQYAKSGINVNLRDNNDYAYSITQSISSNYTTESFPFAFTLSRNSPGSTSFVRDYEINGGHGFIWEYRNTSNFYDAAKLIPVVTDGYSSKLKLYLSDSTINRLVLEIEPDKGLRCVDYGSGLITGTPTYSAAYDTNGKLIEVPEKWGTISTSTDVSGDIVVAHGMVVTPTSVQVTVTGTTPYVVTVHSIDATNFTVRFFDMTGAAVTSTAVTATWHAKT